MTSSSSFFSSSKVRRGRLALSALLLTVLVTGALVVPASAAVAQPDLELFSPRDRVTLFRYGKRQPVAVQLGLQVASHGAAFELMARRVDYATAPTLAQILHGPEGERQEVPLDPAFMNGWLGLKDFFEITFRNADGVEVRSLSLPFCPGNFERERVSDGGPDRPTYPSGCFANPLTKGTIWGIDEGWAVSVEGYEPAFLRIPNGTYQVTVAIAEPYVDLFDIASEMASVELSARVKNGSFCRYEPCEGQGVPLGAQQRYAEVPTMENPDPAILPDLVPLPSWGIHVENRRDRSLLTFGATIWTAGASNLVVEGFRRRGESVMDAYQYFYEKGSVVGKASAGELEYDPRRGHTHWHFKQFAGYSLLTDDQSEVVKSTKEAFCLASTDAIDLTLPGADLDPYIGLSSACGGETSIWVREVLPLGWGDTYHQSMPGQSFDITDVPNGRYLIKVEANPGGLLYEQREDNNVELREVILKGPPGRRRVEVPPWNGIDTESSQGGGGYVGGPGHH
jgi:hypothetical protein